MSLPWLDPCGRPCDWLRSGYTVPMLFDTTADPVIVEWYKAKDGQPWAPNYNRFVSDNWINRESAAGELGEQPGPRPWANGKDTQDYPVQTDDPCSMDDLLVNGLPPGGTTGPWTDGKLECCSSTCCPSITDDLSLTFPAGGGCPCAEGNTIVLSWDAMENSWVGTGTVCGHEMDAVWTCGGTIETCELTLDWATHGVSGPGTPRLDVSSCPPVFAFYDSMDFPIEGSDCDGPLWALVTFP